MGQQEHGSLRPSPYELPPSQILMQDVGTLATRDGERAAGWVGAGF